MAGEPETLVIDESGDAVEVISPSSADEGSSSKVILYYFNYSSPSRKCLAALYEKGVEFEACHMDLTAGEQHQRWYLEMNPRGEVPVLKHGNHVVTESTRILEYIDEHFGSKGQLYPSFGNEKVRNFVKIIDAIPMFPLTYGAALFHREKVTDTLRHPYHQSEVTTSFRALIMSLPERLRDKSLEFSDIEAGKVLAEKAAGFSTIWPLFQDVDKYRVLLAQAEAAVDEIERELASDDHLGPWLCGPTFTAADICVTGFLLRLHQIGLDDKFWTGGIRPHTAVYAEIALQRPSIEKATQYSLHKDKYVQLRSEEDQARLNSAYFGLGAAVALGAVYAYRKLKK